MTHSVISGWLLLALALCMLVLPLQWVFAAIFAAAGHELCHAVAVYLCGGSLAALRIETAGAKMDVYGLTRGKELLCSLAGPTGSFLLLLFAKWLPRTAICAGIQGLYNLLPVYPLDGGRAVRCCAELFLCSNRAQIVCLWLERLCIAGVLLLGGYGSIVLRLGLIPLAASLWVIMRALKGKNTLQTVGKFGTID